MNSEFAGGELILIDLTCDHDSEGQCLKSGLRSPSRQQVSASTADFRQWVPERSPIVQSRGSVFRINRRSVVSKKTRNSHSEFSELQQAVTDPGVRPGSLTEISSGIHNS